MIETITAVNTAVNNFIWGVPAMVCIIGVGLLLSVRTGFLQIRKFPYTIKTTIGRMFRKKDASDGAITPFQAVCTALAGTVGTGNIAGVAAAIAVGGPGAVFWMWVIALVGMMTKMAEVTLSVAYRKKGENGEFYGGPMHYIREGLGGGLGLPHCGYGAAGGGPARLFRRCKHGPGAAADCGAARGARARGPGPGPRLRAGRHGL